MFQLAQSLMSYFWQKEKLPGR
uniref:Uncharacterized protein n=1 Tax=Arundo donax TaxID=35708 RepID=A0A0A9GJT4_ARUDO